MKYGRKNYEGLNKADQGPEKGKLASGYGAGGIRKRVKLFGEASAQYLMYFVDDHKGFRIGFLHQ